MTNKKDIALSSGIDGGLVLLALQSVVVSCVYDGNQKVKFKRKNWSSS